MWKRCIKSYFDFKNLVQPCSYLILNLSERKNIFLAMKLYPKLIHIVSKLE